MPSFCCESCNDVVKKSTINKHRQRCESAAFSCIDCNRTFVGAQVDAHTACVSEAEKYKHNSLFPAKKRPATAAAPVVAVEPVTTTTTNGHADAVKPVVSEVTAAAINGDGDDDDDGAVSSNKRARVAAADDVSTEDEGDFAAVLDQMQAFKWKKSISALLKAHGGAAMPFEQLSATVVDNFQAQFRAPLAKVVDAKVRASKKLRFSTAADGTLVVTTKKD